MQRDTKDTVGYRLAYTRYCFIVSGILCTNQYYSLRTHPLFGYPTHPVIAHTIAHYNVSPRPPIIIATHTTQYWHLQYRVEAKIQADLQVKATGWILKKYTSGEGFNNFTSTRNAKRYVTSDTKTTSTYSRFDEYSNRE